MPTVIVASSNTKKNNKKLSGTTNKKKKKKTERKQNMSASDSAADPDTLSTKASTSTLTDVSLLESEEQRKRIEHDVLECVRSPKSSSTTSIAAKRLYRSINVPLFMKVYHCHLSNIREYLEGIRIIDNNTTSGTVPDMEDGNSSVVNKPAASPPYRCNHHSDRSLFRRNGSTSIQLLYVQMNLARCLATYEIKTYELEMQQQKQQNVTRRTSSLPSSRSRNTKATTTSSTEKIEMFNDLMMDAFTATGSSSDYGGDIETYRSLCLALATHACLNKYNDFAYLMVVFVLFFDTWKKSRDDVHGNNQDRKMAGLELIRKQSRYLTDRGVISFIYKRSPCRCLSVMNKQAKLKLPDDRLCFRCRIPVNATAIFECSMCQTALYCSEDCQSKDWPQHKIDCKCYKQLSAAASEIDGENCDKIPKYEKESCVETKAVNDWC